MKPRFRLPAAALSLDILPRQARHVNRLSSKGTDNRPWQPAGDETTRRAGTRGRTPLPWGFWAVLVLWIVVAGCSTDATDSPNQPPNRTGKVSGRVFDQANGREIAGAFVSLESGRGSVQTVTDPDGAYLFGTVDAGSYRLSVDAGGFRAGFQNVLLAARVHLAVDVGLRPVVNTGDLTGLVLDSTTGAPLGSAVLSVPGKNVTTFTDSGGRFTVRGLNAGQSTVEVRALGHAPFSALVPIPAAGVALETFRLIANAGSVSGTVFSTSALRASRVIPGALVKLLEPNSRRRAGQAISFQTQTTQPLSFAETGVVTRSGADGRYRLDNVTAQTIGLLFTAASHDDQLATTAVLLGSTASLDVQMRFNRATVRGQVTDLNGQPVAGATISVAEQALTTQTDVTGRYALFELVVVKDFPRVIVINGFPVALPPHETPIGASAPGFSQGSALVALVADGTVVLDFGLGRATGTLGGSVRKSRDGTAIPGAVVTLPQLGISTPTNFAGDFAFVDLPPAQLAVNVNAVGFLQTTTFVVVLPGQSSFVRVDLAAPGVLTGTVRKLTGGRPLSSARVALPELARQILTDTAGAYTFTDLPARALRVEFSAQGATSLSTSTTIRDGAVTQLDATLGP
ncbi:MAG: carboxypeptidase regulatory-like domain-containing protein [Candidatus Wallbacteria bacterium]|nr:carboxypeptidase regulatory-like domain-containing protein [Candidatus Wallbacteria bacterium]